MNIADAIADHAQTRPDHPAIESGRRIVSYAQLDALVTNCAANLHEAGIGTGDIVGVMLPDSVNHIAILYALAKLGAISVSLDGRGAPREREQIVTKLGIQLVVAEPKVARVRKTRMLDISRLIDRAAIAESVTVESITDEPFDENQPLMVALSSGTTGIPKGFYLSHADIQARCLAQIKCLGLRATDRYLQVPNLTFLAGRFRCIMMFLLGATVVINHARSTEQFRDSFAAKKITFTYLTPSHVRSLLAAAGDAIEPLLRNAKIVISSAPVKHDHRILARERLTPNVFEAYGASEAGPITYATPQDQDAYPESVGRPIEGVEAEIVDENGAQLATGEVGPIRFRGAGFASSYLNDPEATTQAFRDGWFYPGDLATLNDEGYIFFRGRADDVINNEGAKFYPIEVENALLEHPAIAEAAVFGWPHERVGEVAVAFVVSRSEMTTRELRAFCAQRLAGYKIPPMIVFVPEMPRNRMGKIVKRRLKEQSEKALAQHGGF